MLQISLLASDVSEASGLVAGIAVGHATIKETKHHLRIRERPAIQEWPVVLSYIDRRPHGVSVKVVFSFGRIWLNNKLATDLTLTPM